MDGIDADTQRNRHRGRKRQTQTERRKHKKARTEKERKIDTLFRCDVLFPSPPKFSATERDVEEDGEKEIRRERHTGTGKETENVGCFPCGLSFWHLKFGLDSESVTEIILATESVNCRNNKFLLQQKNRTSWTYLDQHRQ